PMEGRIASLNAAAAGTVVLYEALRQRRRDQAPPGTQTPRPQPAQSPLANETEELAEPPALEPELLTEDEPVDDLVAEDGHADAPVEAAPVAKAPRKPAAKKTVKKATKKDAD